MTTRDDLERIIKRLEEAREGDSALDRAIRDYLSLPAMLVPPDGGDEAYPYSSSVDAALSLVPEDPKAEITGRWDWQLECSNGGMTIWARVGADESTRSFADTPALALCIAALKARLA